LTVDDLAGEIIVRTGHALTRCPVAGFELDHVRCDVFIIRRASPEPA
jgi:hypothetical protein